MLQHPERHDWLATRLEITKKLRTDAAFRVRWKEHQAVLDEAVHSRLARQVADGRMRTDVPIEVLQTYLTTFLEGFITRLASGGPTEGLEAVLDLAEGSVRRPD